MDIKELSPYLEYDVKNTLIINLTLKNAHLALEAINGLTKNYMIKETFDLVEHFYSHMVIKIKQKDEQILMVREGIDKLLIEHLKKEVLKETNDREYIFNFLSHCFFNFSQNCINQLIELTPYFAKNEQTNWLNTITNHSDNFIEISPKITSPTAQQILIKYLDKLEVNSLRNLFANTDLITWYDLNAKFITQHETKLSFNGYHHTVNIPTSFRLATIFDLIFNHLEQDLKEKILEKIVKESSENELSYLGELLEDIEFLNAVEPEQIKNVELIQQYIPFSQYYAFMNSLNGSSFLLTFKTIKPMLDFIASDEKITQGHYNVIDEEDLVENFYTLHDLNLLDDKALLIQFLKFTFIAKEGMNETDLVRAFLAWSEEKQEEIEKEINYYHHFDDGLFKLDNRLHQLEAYVLDGQIELKTTNSQKIKL